VVVGREDAQEKLVSWASVRSATAAKYSGWCSVSAVSHCGGMRVRMRWLLTEVVVAEMLEGLLQLGLDGLEGDDGFLLGSVRLFVESILQLC